MNIWVINVWEFFDSESLHIQIPNIQKQLLQLTHDSYFMDHVQHLPTHKIIHINKCRIYLRIITISDIEDPTVTYIKQNIYLRNPNKSKLLWSTTEQPGDHMWTTWNWAINRYMLNKQHKLKTKLI